MNNLILAQVLGGLFGSARQRRSGAGGALGGGIGGAAVGGILAGMLRNRTGRAGGGGGRGALLAVMLPFAMQWVERNGGLSTVVKRFQERGYGRQVNSWVATGDNQDIDPQAIDEVVGRQELSQLAQQLGVPQDEVKQGFAEILPEMVSQLTPEGEVRPEADGVLQESIPLVEQELEHARSEAAHG